MEKPKSIMIRRPTRRKIEITERDSRIMTALWRWKLLSTSALTIRYFPNGNRHTAYERLHKLAKYNYVKAIYIDKRKQECWGLGSLGFKYKFEEFGTLEEKKYKSEYPYHDHLATAFHLGEWLIDPPPETQTFTEQELRCIHMDSWDSWVPKSNSHRPDGYSIFFNGADPIIVAFETELSIKKEKEYGSIVAFYDSEETINIVLWLVKVPGSIKALKRMFKIFNIRAPEKNHFVLLSDFEKMGWNAKVVDGSLTGQRIRDILPVGQVRPRINPCLQRTELLVDLSKRPRRPRT